MSGEGGVPAKVGAVDVYVLRGVRESLELLVLRRRPGTRCPGAWEVVHGRIESEEGPEEAAERELAEETGLRALRMYTIGVQPFYLPAVPEVLLAVAFAAFVSDGADIRLGDEHDSAEWLDVDVAARRLTWPRSKAMLADARALVGGGTAGAVEDVTRVR